MIVSIARKRRAGDDGTLTHDVPITASFSPVSDVFLQSFFRSLNRLIAGHTWTSSERRDRRENNRDRQTIFCRRHKRQRPVARSILRFIRYANGLPPSKSYTVDARVSISAIRSRTLRAIPDILPGRRASPPSERFLPRQGRRRFTARPFACIQTGFEQSQ